MTNRAREMRKSPTPAEQKMWGILRNRQIDGHEFVRQYTIDQFIVDFCCRQKKLVIEIDGGIHAGQEEYDRYREDALVNLGYRVLRFTNNDVFSDLNSVVARIQEELKDQAPSPRMGEAMAQSVLRVVVRGKG